MFVCFVGKNRAKERGTSGARQIGRGFSDHFGKIEKIGIPLKVFLFFQKLSSGKSFPFDFLPEQLVSSCKWKTPVISKISERNNHCVQYEVKLPRKSGVCAM